MRLRKLLVVIVSLIMVMSLALVVTACDDTKTPHVCSNKCEVCQGCLDDDCQEDACSAKCPGNHDVGGEEHKCESQCPTCGDCTNADCDEDACKPKCPGHEDDGGDEHECESKCPTCGKCTNADCDEDVCKPKCLGHEDVGGGDDDEWDTSKEKDPIFDQTYNGKWTAEYNDATWVIDIQEKAIYVSIDDGEPIRALITGYDMGTSDDVNFKLEGFDRTFNLYVNFNNVLTIGGTVLSRVGGGGNDNPPAMDDWSSYVGYYEGTDNNNAKVQVEITDDEVIITIGGASKTVVIVGFTTQNGFELTVGGEDYVLYAYGSGYYLQNEDMSHYVLLETAQNGGEDNGDDDEIAIDEAFHGVWEGSDSWNIESYKLEITAEGITVYYDGGTTAHEAVISSASATEILFTLPSLSTISTYKLTIKSEENGKATVLELVETFMDEVYTLTPVNEDEGGGDEGGDGDDATFPKALQGNWVNSAQDITLIVGKDSISFNGKYGTQISPSGFGGWNFYIDDHQYMLYEDLNSDGTLSLFDWSTGGTINFTKSDDGDDGDNDEIAIFPQALQGTWVSEDQSITLIIGGNSISFNGTVVTEFSPSSFGGWDFYVDGHQYMLYESLNSNGTLSLFDWDGGGVTINFTQS